MSSNEDLGKLQIKLDAAKDERQTLAKQLTEASDERINEFEKNLATLREGTDAAPVDKTIANLQRTIKEQEIRLALLNTELGCQSAKLQSLTEQNEHLKKTLIAMQTTAEQEEEFISNMLFKRIDSLKSEKKDLLLKVEAEEEIITNQLQEKLNKLQKEKIQMEISLEQEQEAMVNRLQKQLDELRSSESPRRLRMPSGEYKHDKRSSSISSSLSEIPPSSQVVEMMRAENNSLKAKIMEQKAVFSTWASAACDDYARLYVMATKKQDVTSFPPILMLPPLPSPDNGTPAAAMSSPSMSPLSRSSSAQIPQSSPLVSKRLSGPAFRHL